MEQLGVVFGLFVLLVVIATLARRIQVPYPILLVVGGLVIGLLPGLPTVELDPELVLLIFLPPLLYAAAIATPMRELRENLQPISLLAFGLVLATIAAVAATAHLVIPGMSWQVGFTLGAIVSHRTQWRPPRSPTGWACRAGWSPSWKPRACSTTPPPWSPTGWRSPPW